MTFVTAGATCVIPSLSVNWAPLVNAGLTPAGTNATSVLLLCGEHSKANLAKVPVKLLTGKGGSRPLRQAWLTAVADSSDFSAMAGSQSGHTISSCAEPPT